MPFVERLAELGVTKGCAVEPARFCPEQPVTRAQMATFLTRAFFLERADTAGFVDTAGNTHEENIDALAAVRITLGCDVDPPRFCPEALVTRGQMAAFVARALNLAALPQRVSRSVPRLAFSSYSGSYYGGFKVLLVDADGRNLRELTTLTASRDPAWSPDGSQIAYIGDDGRGLFVIDPDGKKPETNCGEPLGSRSPLGLLTVPRSRLPAPEAVGFCIWWTVMEAICGNFFQPLFSAPAPCCGLPMVPTLPSTTSWTTSIATG